MRKIFTTLTLLLAGSGTAFGATPDFFFFNKLGLLIALNVVLGGLMTLCFAVIASYLWEKFRQVRPQPVNTRARQPEALPHANRAVRKEYSAGSRKAANG